jgi:hypothetical protein
VTKKKPQRLNRMMVQPLGLFFLFLLTNISNFIFLEVKLFQEKG